jgi:putative transposase
LPSPNPKFPHLIDAPVLHLTRVSGGIGHMKLSRTLEKQSSFFKSKREHCYKHGGELRKKRAGRFRRPLSCKAPHHIVFKVNKLTLRHRTLRSIQGFALSHGIIKKYAKRFFIKVEQITIQNDHIHMMIRTSRRSLFHNFFRVVAGQIAQQFEKEGLLRNINGMGHVVKRNGKVVLSIPQKVTDTPVNKSDAPEAFKQKLSLWKHRPFSHLIKGFKAYKTVRDYIQLNEKEVTGTIPYRKERLKGLTKKEQELLWEGAGSIFKRFAGVR